MLDVIVFKVVYVWEETYMLIWGSQGGILWWKFMSPMVT